MSFNAVKYLPAVSLWFLLLNMHFFFIEEIKTNDEDPNPQNTNNHSDTCSVKHLVVHLEGHSSIKAVNIRVAIAI